MFTYFYIQLWQLFQSNGNSRHFHDILTTFSRHFHDVRWKKSWKWWYLYTFSRHFHDFFTFSASSFLWQIHNSFTTFSRHFHHAIFTTSWKMNIFSRHFHQGDKGIFTRVSRHISWPTYFHDKFSNRKVSRHFHGLFTTYFHDPFSRCLMKKSWKWYSTKVYFHEIFTTFSRRFAPVVYEPVRSLLRIKKVQMTR